MGPVELLRWQWAGYPGTHTSRGNLLLHLCTVPFFWAGTVLMLLGLPRLDGTWILAGSGCLLVPLAAQGFGHKRLETQAPAPFSSPWNFIARLSLEQWVTFPRFLLSGGWWSNFSAGRVTS